MAPNLYLVLSKPPDGLPPEEYHRWYDLHVRENIVSPGFLGARRYALEPSQEERVVHRHLALYEYEGDMSTWRTDLTRRIDSGEIVLPEWFPEITFSSWAATPLSDRIEPER
jgi:hypothetical protein